LLGLEFDLGEQNAPALVLSLPIFSAVEVPVLPEGRGKGFGEQEELDEVAARCKVFFVTDYLSFVFVDVGKARLGAFFGIRK
jgi:hypothetical protein